MAIRQELRARKDVISQPAATVSPMRNDKSDIPLNPPVATVDQTIDEIMAARRSSTPLRRSFLQKGGQADSTPGPLHGFVTNGDHRGLLLYLLALGKASAKPWDTALAAAVWARALGMELPETATAASTISKAWKRLEDRNLIRRSRYRRKAHIHILKEDGSGDPYEPPGLTKEPHLRLPNAFWQEGPNGDRWYRVLNLPEVAMLLIGLSLSDDFRLPAESVPNWYGISADTAGRGLRGLIGYDLLDMRKHFKTAPLSPAGYTADHLYTLQKPFGPRGRSQRRRRP